MYVMCSNNYYVARCKGSAANPGGDADVTGGQQETQDYPVRYVTRRQPEAPVLPVGHGERIKAVSRWLWTRHYGHHTS